MPKVNPLRRTSLPAMEPQKEKSKAETFIQGVLKNNTNAQLAPDFALRRSWRLHKTRKESAKNAPWMQ
ncbi:MAG: hypothetical protein SP1CHLAM54_15610 [Chlamydiia bacterium]|nr:hypothetical protein [Chlamydiia bacterium]MCH9616451.1 hypothetical protein [Chlamydiia bacterium]MCH9629563.1 hypothetical protein [Chlamydiia bacterium]